MIKKQDGFTLMELMITVVILGVLASFAIPSYMSYATESNRSDAHVALVRMADLQERWYTLQKTYAQQADLASVGGSTTEHDYYTISITAADVNGYTLQAVAKGSQVNDTPCVTITLNSARQKLPAVCWE